MTSDQKPDFLSPVSRRLVDVADTALEVVDAGAGEPVVLIQTALTADELLPIAVQPALAQGYRTLLYHRRGYAGSGPASGPGSVPRDAADCRALLAALDIDRVHVVGLSYSGAVALQVAADAPQLAQTLTLIESPPVHTASAHEFRATSNRLLAARRERGAAPALDEFLTMLIGSDWREVSERTLPGSAAQMERDASTFFDIDLPALLDWEFAATDAGRIACPALYVGAADSGPWFAQVRDLIRRWLPHAEDVVIGDADHSLALTHPHEVAGALVGFLKRHPMGVTG